MAYKNKYKIRIYTPIHLKYFPYHHLIKHTFFCIGLRISFILSKFLFLFSTKSLKFTIPHSFFNADKTAFFGRLPLKNLYPYH